MKCQWTADCERDAMLLMEHSEDGAIPTCGFCAQAMGAPYRSLPTLTEEAQKDWEARKATVEKAREKRRDAAVKAARAATKEQREAVKKGLRGKREMRPRRSKKEVSA